jgi:NodT family efflux transporter outer membrane factor (OMF) lipoprotein
MTVCEKSLLRRLALTYAGIAILLLASCSVGPDFTRPEAPKVPGYHAEPLPTETASAGTQGGEPQRFVIGEDIPAQWWGLFHNPALNNLVAESIKSNPDLQSAQSALRVAMENVKAQEGSYYPSIGAGYSATRANNANPLSPTLASGRLLYNLYQAQLSASWTLDIWGANRRAVEALQAQADAQLYQLEAVYIALTTNVVAAAVQEASLREQIAATESIVKAESESLDILHKQYQLGQVAGADVAAQEAALAQAQQVLPPLEKQLAQQRDLLTLLAGRLPSERIAETFQLASLQLPQDVPVSIPSRLIDRRPDIRIAEANMHAASAEVGVAVANMLPNITISAGAGNVATQMGQLFTPGAAFWSVAGGVTQPLFDGGTLLHKSRGARAAYEQAQSQYRSAVDTAFQNVSDTLYALQYDAETLKAAAAAEHAAADSLAITRRQLELGAISYIALLTAQQTYQQAVIARIQAQAGRLADTAALFQAVGGGWWNGPDISKTQTADTGMVRNSP